MIDTDKYEGHTEGPWKAMDNLPKLTAGTGPFEGKPKEHESWWVYLNEARGTDWTRRIGGTYMTGPDAKLVADAPLLLAEVKRLRESIKELAESWTDRTVGKPSTLLVLAANELKKVIE
jgi:hypothetical protein